MQRKINLLVVRQPGWAIIKARRMAADRTECSLVYADFGE